jgi:hypothetical protein
MRVIDEPLVRRGSLFFKQRDVPPGDHGLIRNPRLEPLRAQREPMEPPPPPAAAALDPWAAPSAEETARRDQANARTVLIMIPLAIFFILLAITIPCL